MRTSNEDRSGPDTEPPHSISFSRWFMLSSLFAIFYLLSTGPAAKLYQRGVLPEPAMAIYAPVDFLYQNVPPAALFLDWYVQRVWHAK